MSPGRTSWKTLHATMFSMTMYGAKAPRITGGTEFATITVVMTIPDVTAELTWFQLLTHKIVYVRTSNIAVRFEGGFQK